MPGCTGIYADIQTNVTDLTNTARVLDLLGKYKSYKETLTKNIQFDGTRRGKQSFYINYGETKPHLAQHIFSRESLTRHHPDGEHPPGHSNL